MRRLPLTGQKDYDVHVRAFNRENENRVVTIRRMAVYFEASRRLDRSLSWLRMRRAALRRATLLACDSAGNAAAYRNWHQFWSGVRVKVGVPLRTWLTRDEFARLLKAARPRERILLETYWHSGARLSEVLGFKIPFNVNFDQGYASTEIRAKGNLRLTKYIPLDLYKRALALRPVTYLFERAPGVPLRGATVQALLRRLRSVCGFGRQITPHSIRRSVATDLFERNNENLYEVKEFLGHTSLSSTLAYTRLTYRPERVLSRIALINKEQEA